MLQSKSSHRWLDLTGWKIKERYKCRPLIGFNEKNQINQPLYSIKLQARALRPRTRLVTSFAVFCRSFILNGSYHFANRSFPCLLSSSRNCIINHFCLLPPPIFIEGSGKTELLIDFLLVGTTRLLWQSYFKWKKSMVSLDSQPSNDWILEKFCKYEHRTQECT